jgi:hypothetical protein
MTDSPDEWSSYLPDGRPILVRRRDDSWFVACEERTSSDPDLAVAMEEAAGIGDRLLALSHTAEDAMRRWIARHSARIADELD